LFVPLVHGFDSTGDIMSSMVCSVHALILWFYSIVFCWDYMKVGLSHIDKFGDLEYEHKQLKQVIPIIANRSGEKATHEFICIAWFEAPNSHRYDDKG